MGEEGFSEEPELNNDQNIKVEDRELQVAGRFKYFLYVWMDITPEKSLDMVEHYHLELTENFYEQYPKPPIRLILKRQQLLMVKFNNCLAKGFSIRLTLVMIRMSLPFFLRKKKNGSYRLILNLKGLNASIEY